jgi:hypothetical protein
MPSTYKNMSDAENKEILEAIKAPAEHVDEQHAQTRSELRLELNKCLASFKKELAELLLVIRGVTI